MTRSNAPFTKLSLLLLVSQIPTMAWAESKTLSPKSLVTLVQDQSSATSEADVGDVSASITDVGNGKCEVKVTNNSDEKVSALKLRVEGVIGAAVMYREWLKDEALESKASATHAVECSRNNSRMDEVRVILDSGKVG